MEVQVPRTRFVIEFLSFLERHGIISCFTLIDGTLLRSRYMSDTVLVHLRYSGSQLPLRFIEIPKHPSSSYRLSLSTGDMGKFARFMNTLVILSTDRGLLSATEARHFNLGGIVIAIVHY